MRVITFFIYGLLYILAQLYVFKDLVFFHTAFCFIYVVFLLHLPFDLSRVGLLLVAFFYGLLFDLFYQTFGLHTAACVLLAYFREPCINFVEPESMQTNRSDAGVFSQGIKVYLSYTLPLIFIHHLVLFVLETWKMSLFGTVLLKTFFSTLFTLSMTLLFQYLLPNKTRR